MKESYLMIKPDGQRYLPEIEEMVISKGFFINSIYYVEDWGRVSAKIYSECLIQGDEVFRQDYAAHVWLNKYIFGNSSVVLMLSKENVKDKALVQEILDLKKAIRNRFNATKNGTFMMVMDINKIDLPKVSFEGFLCIKKHDKCEIVDEYISQEGTFRAFFLQYVHSPDADVDLANREIKILKDEGVICEKKLLTAEEWENMKHYRSLSK